MKKIISLVLALVMVFGIAGCNQLTRYKEERKGLIDAHAATKAQSNYSAENWEAILQAVADGKAAIDAATDNATVDAAVANAIEAINRINNKLAEYKIAGEKLIYECVAAKVQSNYSAENWEAILQAALDGKEAIDDATNKTEVDTAVALAIDKIEKINDEFTEYKNTGKGLIDAQVAAKTQRDYLVVNWEVILQAVTDGNAAIDDATDKTGVDTAVALATEKIRAVENKANGSFPSKLEDFDLAEFTDEFFEDYTLILVPFEWGHLLYEYLDFYSVYVENGKLNFLMEITYPPYMGSSPAEDIRLFAVIISNEVFSKYEIGESVTFDRYTIPIGDGGTPAVENDRKSLKEAEQNAIEHRVSYVYSSSSFPLSNPVQIKREVNEIVAISSTESLSEYF